MGGGKRQAIHHYDSIHEIWNRLLLNVEARQSTQRELGVPHVIDFCMRESVPSVSQSVAGNGAALAGVGAAFAVVHRVLCALGCAGFARLGAKRKYRLHVFAARRDRPRCQPANIGAFQVQPDAANHRFGVTLLKAGSSTLKAGRRALVAGAKAFDLFLTKHNFLAERRIFGSSIISSAALAVCSVAHTEWPKRAWKKPESTCVSVEPWSLPTLDRDLRLCLLLSPYRHHRSLG